MYKNPIPTVDVIIKMDYKSIVLIKRKNPPYGWALPGGFVNEGESLEDAAIREIKEETGLNIKLIRQFHTYSDPNRDPRGHHMSTVFIAKGDGLPYANDDATDAGIYTRETLPDDIAFDHRKILNDFFSCTYLYYPKEK